MQRLRHQYDVETAVGGRDLVGAAESERDVGRSPDRKVPRKLHPVHLERRDVRVRVLLRDRAREFGATAAEFENPCLAQRHQRGKAVDVARGRAGIVADDLHELVSGEFAAVEVVPNAEHFVPQRVCRRRQGGEVLAEAGTQVEEWRQIHITLPRVALRPTRLHALAPGFAMLRLARFLPGLIAALAPLLAVSALAADITAVAPDPFFKHADYGDLQLSPSGKYLAGLIPAAGRLRLGVIDLDAKSSRIVALDGRAGHRQFLLGERRPAGVFGDGPAGGAGRAARWRAVRRQPRRDRFPDAGADGQANHRASGQMVFRYTALHSTLRDGSDDVLVLNNERNARFPDVYRMDTRPRARRS